VQGLPITASYLRIVIALTSDSIGHAEMATMMAKSNASIANCRLLSCAK
jgi:hypothetical protein